MASALGNHGVHDADRTDEKSKSKSDDSQGDSNSMTDSAACDGVSEHYKSNGTKIEVSSTLKNRLEHIGITWEQAVSIFERIDDHILKSKNVDRILLEMCRMGHRHVEMYEVDTMLRKYGVSVQDIFLAVMNSVLLLCLVFLFLFIGIGAFSEGDPEPGQAAVNSLITGGAAWVMNMSRSEQSPQKLRKIVDKAMEDYKKNRTSNILSFSMDEDISAVSTMDA